MIHILSQFLQFCVITVLTYQGAFVVVVLLRHIQPAGLKAAGDRERVGNNQRLAPEMLGQGFMYDVEATTLWLPFLKGSQGR